VKWSSGGTLSRRGGCWIQDTNKQGRKGRGIKKPFRMKLLEKAYPDDWETVKEGIYADRTLNWNPIGKVRGKKNNTENKKKSS